MYIIWYILCGFIYICDIEQPLRRDLGLVIPYDCYVNNEGVCSINSLENNSDVMVMNWPFRRTWIYPPIFNGDRVTRSFVFCQMFCRSLFVLLSFFFRTFCCLSCDLRILITPLVSSNSSYFNTHQGKRHYHRSGIKQTNRFSLSGIFDDLLS